MTALNAIILSFVLTLSFTAQAAKTARSSAEPRRILNKNSLYGEIRKKNYASQLLKQMTADHELQFTKMDWSSVLCTDEPEDGVYFCQLPLRTLEPSPGAMSLFFQVDTKGSLVNAHEAQVACANCH